MSRRIHLPPHLAEGAFLVAQARMSGINYGRTRGDDLVAPFHGVRVPAGRDDPDSPEDRIARLAVDYAPRLRPGQFYCELTALVLFGAPVPPGRSNERVLHIGSNGPAAPPRTRGVRSHFVPHQETFVADGLPTCSPVEAWIECAASAGLDDLVVLGDSLVKRKLPLSTMGGLESAVAGASGRHGSKLLREAVTLVRPRTDSPRETRVRLLIGRCGLPEPEVNRPIFDSAGVFIGFGDLVYPEFKLIIEYDGEHHFGLDEQRIHDLERVALFIQARWSVIQMHKAHLDPDPTAILERIRVALIEAGWRP